MKVPILVTWINQKSLCWWEGGRGSLKVYFWVKCCLYPTVWLLGVKSISCLTVFTAPVPQNILSEQLSLFVGEADDISWCRWYWKSEVLNFRISPVFSVFLSGWAALKTVSFLENSKKLLIISWLFLKTKGQGNLVLVTCSAK